MFLSVEVCSSGAVYFPSERTRLEQARSEAAKKKRNQTEGGQGPQRYNDMCACVHGVDYSRKSMKIKP